MIFTANNLTDQDQMNNILGAAPLLMAFIECSNELQLHAKEMLTILQDPEADSEDRDLALMTLADILFPNTHEGDQMLGLDMKIAEELARDTTESKLVLEQMDEEESTFARKLESIMADRGLTQAELASRIGVGQSAIAMMLKRECRPQKRTIRRLAEGLQVSPCELWPSFDDK